LRPVALLPMPAAAAANPPAQNTPAWNDLYYKRTHAYGSEHPGGEDGRRRELATRALEKEDLQDRGYDYGHAARTRPALARLTGLRARPPAAGGRQEGQERGALTHRFCYRRGIVASKGAVARLPRNRLRGLRRHFPARDFPVKARHRGRVLGLDRGGPPAGAGAIPGRGRTTGGFRLAAVSISPRSPAGRVYCWGLTGLAAYQLQRLPLSADKQPECRTLWTRPLFARRFLPPRARQIDTEALRKQWSGLLTPLPAKGRSPGQ
jgi:hypothetical protein